MNLRDRLRSMQGAAKTPVAPDVARECEVAPAADVQDVPASIATRPQTAVTAHDLDSLLPGSVCETPHGDCYVVEWRYPLSHQHGISSLETALDVTSGDGASLLARTAAERVALAGADPRSIVYLDTETTGLAGGTGTYAFLVGIARFVEGELVVRQIFMRELGEEYAALHLLAEELAECTVLVTYNGKAYDWPLLETRFALGRRLGPARPRDPRAHVDLLFAARRLWRTRLDSCSLAQVERDMLGVSRSDDTPGWLIPQLYFTYLRSRDARPLTGVFRHNALDLLSLAMLLGRVARTARLADRGADADELVALGRCFEETHDFARALVCYEAAIGTARQLTGTLGAAVSRDARTRAAVLLKRLRRSADAVAHWEALLSRGMTGQGMLDVRPFVELAKHYEHVSRDHDTARVYVQRALAALDGDWSGGAQRERSLLLHRLRRLERILGLEPAAD